MKRSVLVVLAMATSLTVSACGPTTGSRAVGSQAGASPLCPHVTALREARGDFLEALVDGRAGRFKATAAKAKLAYDEATAVSEAMSDSDVAAAKDDETFFRALFSVLVVINQASFLLQDGDALRSSDIEMIVAQVLPGLDAAMTGLDEVAAHGDASGPARCPGMEAGFVPWEAVLGGPPATPDVAALGLPGELAGATVNVSAKSIPSDGPLAPIVRAAGGSLTTAYSASVDAGVLNFSVLRIPGADVGALVDRIAGAAFPDADIASSTPIDIESAPAVRYQTPDAADVSPATYYAVPRGDTVYLFEDVDLDVVSEVIASLP